MSRLVKNRHFRGGGERKKNKSCQDLLKVVISGEEIVSRLAPKYGLFGGRQQKKCERVFPYLVFSLSIAIHSSWMRMPMPSLSNRRKR